MTRFISTIVQLCTLDSYYFDGRRIRPTGEPFSEPSMSIDVGAAIAADCCAAHAFDNPNGMVRITITENSITFGPAPDAEDEDA